LLNLREEIGWEGSPTVGTLPAENITICRPTLIQSVETPPEEYGWRKWKPTESAGGNRLGGIRLGETPQSGPELVSHGMGNTSATTLCSYFDGTISALRSGRFRDQTAD